MGHGMALDANDTGCHLLAMAMTMALLN